MLGMKKSRITPYHPQGDLQPERFNHTLFFYALSPTHKLRWSQYVAFMVQAYNCTRNKQGTCHTSKFKASQPAVWMEQSSAPGTPNNKEMFNIAPAT